MKPVKITKNTKLNIGYIEIKKTAVFKTVRVGKDVLIDLDRKGGAIGIELLTLGDKPRSKRTSKKKSA